jgi:hypothetical protein
MQCVKAHFSSSLTQALKGAGSGGKDRLRTRLVRARAKGMQILQLPSSEPSHTPGLFLLPCNKLLLLVRQQVPRFPLLGRFLSQSHLSMRSLQSQTRSRPMKEMDRRSVITGIVCGAAVATFGLTVMPKAAKSLPLDAVKAGAVKPQDLVEEARGQCHGNSDSSAVRRRLASSDETDIV